MKLNTTLGIALIGAGLVTGASWMALPSLQASQEAVNAEAAVQVERARRLLYKFDPKLVRKSLLLDRLALVNVDVDVEDPAELANTAAAFYHEQHETAWEAYQPMDWGNPPRKARASYGNIERQIRDALADRAELMDLNDQWLGEALDAVNQALALQLGNADARSNTEANRLKSVIQFHQGLTAWLRANVKRQEAGRFKHELVDTAIRIAEFQVARTVVEYSGIDDQIQRLRDDERKTLEAIAEHKDRLARVESNIATLERQLGDATKEARAAEDEMTRLRGRGVDFTDPDGMTTFKKAFMESERAYRNAHRRIQSLQSGDFPRAKIDRSGDFLTGRYVERGSDRNLTVKAGRRHYQGERAVLLARIEVLEGGLPDHRAAIDRVEGLGRKLRIDSELAIREIPDAVSDAADAFDEMNRLESEAFAIEEDALDDLEEAAEAAKLAAGNARSDLANARDRLGSVSIEARDKSAFSLLAEERWIGGHILAQVADARLGKAWIHYERYVAHSRNAVVLEEFGEMLQLREADIAIERTKASEAHDAGVEEIQQAMTQLQQAHKSSKHHWTFVAQQGAVNHLMVLFGHPKYRNDAIAAYRNAVNGREDEPSAKPFLARLKRLENQ